MSVVVYVADGCPHCARLLADFRRRCVEVVCVNLSRAPERAREVVDITWDTRLPVVVDHERFAVGFAGESSSFAELGLEVPPP